MSRLKVAVVTPGSFVIPSGRSSSVEQAVEQLARRLCDRFELRVFGRLGGRPAAERREGVSYRRVAAPSPRAYIRSVSARLRLFRPDVIQVENRPRFIPFLRKRHPHASLVLVLHSVTFASPPRLSAAGLHRCLGAADRIVVNSDFLKEELLRSAPFAGNKIVVSHLGVDERKFSPCATLAASVRRERLRAKLGLEGRRIILFVGRLLPIKGVHLLLRAMPQVAEQAPDAALVVVGSAGYRSRRRTPYVRRLHRTAERLGDRVRFVPFVEHGAVPDWFRLADVLAVPSGRMEAFGLVNVEAMATGVPVVATRCGGMTEIIEDGVTGRLVDLEAAERELAPTLAALLRDEPLRRGMGERGRSRVEAHFTWTQAAERWAKLYDELRPRPAPWLGKP